MKHRASLALVVAALAVAALALRAGVAANPTIVVNSAADVHDANPGDGVCETASGNGICTLRAAIEEANALAGADTIAFSSSLPNPAIFSISLGSLPVSTDLTINGGGAGSTIIDGSGFTSGIFSISGPSTVTISGVTIQNGVNSSGLKRGGAIYVSATLNLSNVVISHNSADSGGGIFASGGSVTLDHCTVTNNSATDATNSNAGGGGIYSTGMLTLNSSAVQSNSTQREGAGIKSIGALVVTSSTISANPARLDGGGLYSLGTATITSSTIDGNSSAGGGGIFADGVSLQNVTVSRNLAHVNGGGLLLIASGTSNLINSTVTQNEAVGIGGAVLTASAATIHAYNSTITSNQAGVSQMGGGVFLTASGSSIANTVLALNYRMSKLGNVPTDCAGTLTSLDYNLVQTLTDCTITGAAAHNVYGTDPNLGPLQDNGGPTQTSALLTGSPAIDTGNPSGCTDNVGATLTTDQRGFPRPINGRCDMGAYEFGSALPTPTPTRTPTSTPTPTPTRTATPNPLARSFFTLAPCRVIDTRGAPGPLGGPALAAGATRNFVLAGTCGIPASAKVVSINVTVTEPTAAGDLRLFAGGAPLPLVSTINYRAMQTRANNAVVTLGASGDIAVLSDQASGTVQFILDVDGYFQ